jgi:hypothetical protein
MRSLAARAVVLLGCACVVAALVIIWVARVSVGRDVYVSELGATSMPTARWFEAALLLIVVGATVIAWAARGLRSWPPILKAWIPAISLWISAGGFLVASQVPCTTGCPVPYGPGFTWQNFTHTTVAVLAFAAACWAMVQVAFAKGHRAIAIMSLACAIAVAVVAGAGGLFSLFRFDVNLGSRFELVATTIGLGWLAALGLSLVLQKREHLVGQANELVDLVLVPVDPAHLGPARDGHEPVVLLPDQQRAVRAEHVLLPPDLPKV